MHLLMTALGSYGDVHPMVGLGAAMRVRGHPVSVISNPHFQSVVESAGLEFLALGTVEDYEQLSIDPNVWHPIRGPLMILKHGVADMVRELYGVIESNYRPGETKLVAHCLDVSSRVFQEKHDVPLASVVFAPMVFRSFNASPRMGSLLMDGWVPRWLRWLEFWIADRLVIDRIIGPELNGLRRELGLAPVGGILRSWYYSPQLVLGLFPEWFAPAQSDWPPNTQLTGFPLWDQAIAEGLPAEVAEFVDAGTPPIVFTPGSAMAHGRSFFQAACEACRRLDRRGILLTKYSDQIPADLPEGVRHFDFVPFSQLLPRAAALVHHGGIGSCAQALTAGVPQLVMPMAFDQPDNVARLERLGVVASLQPNKFRGPAVARALDKMLSDKKVQQACDHWAQKCDSAGSLAESCNLLEKLGS